MTVIETFRVKQGDFLESICNTYRWKQHDVFIVTSKLYAQSELAVVKNLCTNQVMEAELIWFTQILQCDNFRCAEVWQDYLKNDYWIPEPDKFLDYIFALQEMIKHDDSPGKQKFWLNEIEASKAILDIHYGKRDMYGNIRKETVGNKNS